MPKPNKEKPEAVSASEEPVAEDVLESEAVASEGEPAKDKFKESYGFSEKEQEAFQAMVKEDVEKGEIDSVIEEEEEVLDVPEKEISVGA